MRKLSIIAAFVVAVAVIFGCKPSAQNNEKDAETADSTAMSGSEEQTDSTMYGTYVDGGMSAFDMKCDDDSVRNFVIEQDSGVVFGGFAQGDQLAVDYKKNGLGENIVTKRHKSDNAPGYMDKPRQKLRNSERWYGAVTSAGRKTALDSLANIQRKTCPEQRYVRH